MMARWRRGLGGTSRTYRLATHSLWRGLRLKHPRAPVLSCQSHLDALGHQITRDGLTARPRALHKLRRRVDLALPGPGVGKGSVDLRRSVASSAGVVLF